MDVVLGDRPANIAKVVAHLHRLAAQGVDLAVFPECALTGYGFASLEEAELSAVQSPSELDPVQDACTQLGLHAVVGYAFRTSEGLVQNAASLFLPTGEPQYYAKTHLPCLGLDRFAQRGNDLPVFETALGRIGVLICYDMRPPEAARTLALKGADLIVLPTNWPEGAETSAEHIVIARAAENKVFMASCNRTGEESGFRFIGRSKIVSPAGRVLAAASDGEEVLIADIDLNEARQKRTINRPGEYELDILGERRPELYGILQQPWNAPEAG